MSKTALTPADLDLKKKDRIPGYFPKVGDLVKIKSRKWYEKWKDGGGYVDISYITFTPAMVSHCGCYRTVKGVFGREIILKEDYDHFTWVPEFFEEVLPVNEVVAFSSTDANPVNISYQSPYSGTILSGTYSADEFPSITHLSGYGGMTAEEAIKPFTVKDLPVIHFTNNSVAEEPLPLKTIKRKRFIKIKNL